MQGWSNGGQNYYWNLQQLSTLVNQNVLTCKVYDFNVYFVLPLNAIDMQLHHFIEIYYVYVYKYIYNNLRLQMRAEKYLKNIGSKSQKSKHSQLLIKMRLLWNWEIPLIFLQRFKMEG